MTKPKDLVTQSVAAHLSGKSRQHVNAMISRRHIKAYGPDRLVSLSDVLNYRPRRRGGQAKTPDESED